MRTDFSFRTYAKAFHTSALLAFGLSASATVYYVSPSGDDANNGTSQTTAWRTIARVNQSAFSLQPGRATVRSSRAVNSFPAGPFTKATSMWPTFPDRSISSTLVDSA